MRRHDRVRAAKIIESALIVGLSVLAATITARVSHYSYFVVIALIAVAALNASSKPSTTNFAFYYGTAFLFFAPNHIYAPMSDRGGAALSILLAVTLGALRSSNIGYVLAKLTLPLFAGYMAYLLSPKDILDSIAAVTSIALISASVSAIFQKVNLREFFFGSFFADLLYLSISYLGYNLSPLFGLIAIGIIVKNERGRLALSRDLTTGLGNYTSFLSHIEKNLSKHEIAIILFSIENYQEIINQLGISFGDQLVRLVATRAQNSCRKSDLVARLSGDTFGICLQVSDEDAKAATERIYKEINANIKVGKSEVPIRSNFGVSTSSLAVANATKLIDSAYLASRRGKSENAKITFFDEEADGGASKKIDLLEELPEAIRNNQLFLAYQPKISLATKRVDGVEALVRWQHPNRGVITPDSFIPSAEQTEIIKPLTTWVVKTALDQIALWQAQGIYLQVAVNASFANLLDPDFAPMVISEIRARGLFTDAIEIEITENVGVSKQSSLASDSISQLRSAGISIALDDFGTGYSSLSYISKISADTIKIDKEFIFGLSDRGNEIIVKSILDLASKFGYKTVAEGVEDVQTFLWLHENGCDYAQGYFISKPLSANDIPAWVNAFNLSSSNMHLIEGRI